MTLVSGTATIEVVRAGGGVEYYTVFPSGSFVTNGAFLETKFTDLEEFGFKGESLKHITGIMVEVQTENQPTSLSALIGTKENVNDTPVWNGPYALQCGIVKDVKIDLTRLVAVRISDAMPTVDYQISRIVLFGSAPRRGHRKTQ